MPRILVVDDEPRLVGLMQATLIGQGYEVETASNGVEALAKIRANHPDLMVSDAMMPQMDGFELLKNVRGDIALRDLPVIMLMARAQEGDIMRGYERGADMYLTKPFNPQEMLQFVKRVLAAHGTSDGRYNV